MPYLEINLSSDTLIVPFSGRVDYVIGRLPRADIQLRDMKVSRVHTQLFTDSRGKAFVRDLGSSGGTVLNGAKLKGGAIEPLTRDSRVRIGDARITYHEGPPPSGSPAIPSRSAPRAIIRTHERARATPPASAKNVSPTETGPAEAPPDVNQDDFVGDPNAPPSEPPPPPEAHKGLSASTGNVAPKRKDTGVLEAPWESAESTRAKAVGDRRVTLTPPTRTQPMPSAEIDETGRFHDPAEKPHSRPDTRKPLSPLPPRVPLTPPPLGSSAAFVPPPPPAPPPPPPADDDAAPRVGMPTVRLDKAAIAARKAAEEDDAPPKIPTAIVQPGARAPLPADSEPGEPRIGMAPGERPPSPIDEAAEAPMDDSIPIGESLTSGLAAQQMGAAAGPEGEPVNFGEEGETEDATDEVEFNKRVTAGTDSDPDFDAPQTTRAPARSGAMPNQGFAAPRKTRKLMKRRTDRLEDAQAMTPRTDEVPLPGVAQGGQTVFVPRPENMPKPRSAPRIPLTGQDAESLTKKVEKLGRGPGGDTLAVGPSMIKELNERTGLTPPPSGQPEIIIEEGDTIDEGDVISDSSAMLTPPPINETRPRKGRTKIQKPTDFMTDPPVKRTPPPSMGGETRIE